MAAITTIFTPGAVDGLNRIGTGLGSQADPLESRGEPGGSLDHGRHRAELLSIGRRVIEQVDQEPLRHHVGRQRLAHAKLANEQAARFRSGSRRVPVCASLSWHWTIERAFRVGLR